MGARLRVRQLARVVLLSSTVAIVILQASTVQAARLDSEARAETKSSQNAQREQQPKELHFEHSLADGATVDVWVYQPSGINAETAPVLMMMHGAKRNARSYLRGWREPAERGGFVIVAPEFDREQFPGSRGYNLGNMFESERAIERQPEASWTFAAIEPIFRAACAKLGNRQVQFTLYGHSAGAQFAHRYLLFMPDAPVQRVLIANAGWYTFPDANIDFPYGLAGAQVPAVDLARVLEADVVVLLGEGDSDPGHDSLRRTLQANQQGAHRFARGLSFFEAGQREARARQLSFGWRLHRVPGVAHDNAAMAAAAAQWVR